MNKEIIAIRLRLFWIIICLVSMPIIIYSIINKSDVYLWIGLSIVIITFIIAMICPPQILFEGFVVNFHAIPFSNIANLGIDKWNWNVVLAIEQNK